MRTLSAGLPRPPGWQWSPSRRHRARARSGRDARAASHPPQWVRRSGWCDEAAGPQAPLRGRGSSGSAPMVLSQDAARQLLSHRSSVGCERPGPSPKRRSWTFLSTNSASVSSMVNAPSAATCTRTRTHRPAEGPRVSGDHHPDGGCNGHPTRHARGRYVIADRADALTCLVADRMPIAEVAKSTVRASRPRHRTPSTRPPRIASTTRRNR
jgi:hypothetical protein